MFVASLCDALPSLIPAMQSALEVVRPDGVENALTPFSDGILSGSKFVVSLTDEHSPSDDGDPHHVHGHGDKHTAKHHHHHHRHWRDIRSMLEAAQLPQHTREAALGIFELLAEAEASVHGIDVASVAFHEVGAWDSIVDIVAAASIIAQLRSCAWSIGPLPIGRGMVKSAHGMLPVPAPATVKLLNGFTTIDDGEVGERITPTGAAILAYLQPSQSTRGEHLRLAGSGTGHGTRRLERRSNVLRSLVFESANAPGQTDIVEVLRCEIDDQSGEDLAIALEHIRAQSGVLDVCQWPIIGKKGRMGTALQIIVVEGSGDDIAEAVLDETTTLGVRHQKVTRNILERQQHDVDGTGVKIAKRPSGLSANAEADDTVAMRSAAAPSKARRLAEDAALQKTSKDES